MTLGYDNETIDVHALRDLSLQNMENAASYDKCRFDSNKAKVINFEGGDHVLLKNEERHQTKKLYSYKELDEIDGEDVERDVEDLNQENVEKNVDGIDQENVERDVEDLDQENVGKDVEYLDQEIVGREVVHEDVEKDVRKLRKKRLSERKS
ncbi:ring-infected erythrocyte surface antigen-like [Coccinella septempunctata]|uniref:ring-infected erythrocyte surface antigen-like n=1 Tax=Coccinella septempunctata TaxID=41139 RepID=UPI001D07D510|nr:ring-infected erythrocyte surface antigen-like [Coccinella septempunctata]